MTAGCPLPPSGTANLKVGLAEVSVGTALIRFHPSKYRGTSFNPNIDEFGKPRNMDDARAGARFSPFADLIGAGSGANVSTLYAGTTDRAAALESVFHDLPHMPSPTFASSQLKGFVLSRFTVKRPLMVLELVNPQLRQLPVEGRAASLTEGELISSSPSNYPSTRAWAQHLHRCLPTLAGLA
jgi:hypothetical protein